MTISEERLVELIEGFCAAVLSLSGMVCRAFSVQDLLAGVKSKRIPRAARRMGLSFSFMEEAAGFGTPEHGWTSIFFQTANLTGLTPGGCIGS